MVCDANIQGFERWYRGHRRRKTGHEPAPSTMHAKRVTLTSACKRIEADSPGEYTDVAEALVFRPAFEALLARMEDEVSPGAVVTYLYGLTDYANFCIATGVIEEHVIMPEDFPSRNPDKPITVYTPTEMERIKSAAWGRGLRWGMFVNFLAWTGRRVGEALSIEHDWVHIDQKPPYIEYPRTKNGSAQYVPLGAYLAKEVFTEANLISLHTAERDGAQAFRRDVNRFVFPWGYATVNGRWKLFLGQLGIENRGFHNLRHTVITKRLADGIPLHAVSQLAGHSSSAITEKRYAHTTALTFAHFVD